MTQETVDLSPMVNKRGSYLEVRDNLGGRLPHKAVEREGFWRVDRQGNTDKWKINFYRPGDWGVSWHIDYAKEKEAAQMGFWELTSGGPGRINRVGVKLTSTEITPDWPPQQPTHEGEYWFAWDVYDLYRRWLDFLEDPDFAKALPRELVDQVTPVVRKTAEGWLQAKENSVKVNGRVSSAYDETGGKKPVFPNLMQTKS